MNISAATRVPALVPALVRPAAAASSSRALEKLDGALSLHELDAEAAGWVRAGYDEPDRVLRQLDELQQGMAGGPPLAWARVLERTRGLVAARAGRDILPGVAGGLWDIVRAADPDSASALPCARTVPP